MTTFVNYNSMPEPIREQLLVLEEFIGALDGKTTDDDGTIDAEDAVAAFNAIVAALSSPVQAEIPRASESMDASGSYMGTGSAYWNPKLER